MFIRVLSFVYLFLIRLRFPACSSVAEIIRKRYGALVMSKIRKFEKLNFRIGKNKLDITFLETCVTNDVMPNFVQFKTANKNLKRSETYSRCQMLLLTQESNGKNVKLMGDIQNLQLLKAELQGVLSSLDFLYISSLFLDQSSRALKQIELMQNTKLSKLIEVNPKHNANDLIYNFSSRTLTSSQQSILIKGLNFSLPSKGLKTENYFLDFELLFRNVKTGANCVGEELANFKSELRHIAHSSLQFYNRKKKKLENITEEELNALNVLASFDDIIIQKADKENVIVWMDKSSYICKMEYILSDTSKCSPISFERGYDDLKYILQKERDIRFLLA